MRLLPLLAAAALAGCGEPVAVDDRSPAEQNETAAGQMVPEARPVRVGELGPSFDACGGAGTTRAVKAGEALPVRAAPFETAPEAGRVAAGARFFVCSRSLDQKWIGIVHSEEGTLDERCGVSSPVARRQDYEGPCRSGWVPSALVKLVSGVDLPAQANPPAAAAAENAGAGA